jgi:protein tyrosine/serine phosphatase
LVALALLSLSGSAAQAFQPIAVPGLDNFQSVSEDRLYRGANPSENDLKALQQGGVKCIINLRHSDAKEEAVSKQLGLKYVHMPMGWFKPPSAETVHKFLAVVQDPQNQPAYIHCYQGADRTGTMVAIYRIVVQNWGFSEAYKEMRQHHFKPLLASLKHFVLHYSAQPITAESRDELSVKTDKMLITGADASAFVKLGM